jgi:hypothetical protein
MEKNKVEEILAKTQKEIEEKIVRKKRQKKSEGQGKRGQISESAVKRAAAAYSAAYLKYRLRCKGISIDLFLRGITPSSVKERYREYFRQGIKPVTLTPKDLGVLKNILRVYGEECYYDALEVIANTLAPNQAFTISLVAAEVARQVYKNTNLKIIKRYEVGLHLYRVPIAKVAGYFEEKFGQYRVLPVGNKVVVDDDFNLKCPSSFEVKEIYENNIQAIKFVGREMGYVRNFYLPSPFSESFIGVGGELVEKNGSKAVVNLYVDLINLNDAPFYDLVIPAETYLALDFKYLEEERDKSEMKDISQLPQDYYNVFTEIKKNLIAQKSIILSARDFPVFIFLDYLKSRVQQQVLGVNAFNSSLEYFDTFVVVDLRGKDYHHCAQHILGFLDSEALAGLFIVNYDWIDLLGLYKSLINKFGIKTHSLAVGLKNGVPSSGKVVGDKQSNSTG